MQAPATAITYPSAFATHTGAAHWETLLRARAIEGWSLLSCSVIDDLSLVSSPLESFSGQCYVFGSAQTGEHYAGRRSFGHAMIVDPWGTVVAYGDTRLPGARNKLLITIPFCRQCPQTNKPELCIAEVDLDYVKKIRREMPMGWPEL